MKALQLILFILLMVFSTVRGWASAAATLTNHNLLYFQIDALPTAIPTNVIMLTGNLTNWQKLVTNVICNPCLIINPTIPRVPYKFGPAQFMDSSLLWQSDTNTYTPTLELGLAPAYWTDPRPDLGGFFKVDNRGMGVINAVEFQSGITSNDNGGATFKIQMGDYDVGHNATTYAANINTSVDSFNAVPTGDQTDGAIAIYGGSDGNGVRNIGVNGATGGEATNNIAVLAGADRDNVLGRTNIALKADIADPGAWSPVQIAGFFDVGRHASTPSNETAMVLIDNRSTGYPLIIGRTNNGTRQFYVAASTGYTGTGTNALTDDGTYKPFGSGATINPTDTYIPYRLNATTFADSPISRLATNILTIASSTNQFLWVSDPSTFALGYQAAGDRLVGANSIAIGQSAMERANSESQSIAIGTTTLRDSFGSDNVAVGYRAMLTSTSANNSVAIGAFTLDSVLSGYDNTGVGVESLSACTTGNNNTAYGYKAGLTITTGSTNVFIGTKADAVTSGLTNVIAIGANTKVTNSNEIVIGNTANTKAIFPITSYTGTGANALTDDGTYKPCCGLGTIINPSDTFVPYRINGTTFGDSWWYYLGNGMGIDTNIFLGPGVTNRLYRFGTDLYYENAGTQNGIMVTNSNTHQSGLFGIKNSGDVQVIPGSGTLWLQGTTVVVGNLVPSTTNTRNVGLTNTSTGAWANLAAFGLNVIGKDDGLGNTSWLKVHQPDTNSPVIFDQQTAGTAGYSRGFQFQTNGVPIFTITGSGIFGVVTNVMNALNVKDPPFNAKGDGSVNDAPALQLAINTATAHSPVLNVFIPAGVYKIQSTITITNSVEVLGAGSGELETTPGHITVIQKDADVVAFQLSAKHIALRNLTVQGAGDSTEGILIGDATTDAGDAILDNVTVRLCGSDGIWVKNGNCCHLRVDTWGNLGHGLRLESVVVAFDNVNANVVDLKATSNGLDGLRMVKSAVNMVKVVSQGNGGWGIYNGYPNSMIEAYTEANTSGSYYGTSSAFSGTLSGKFNEGDPVMDNRYNIVQNSNATNSWFRFLYNIATATNLTVETESNLQGFVHANRLTATNGIIHKFKSSFSTDYSIGTATNQQFFLLSGTNQLITLPPAAGVQGIIYRFSMTNGWGSFILTNAADGATIRDGTSLSYTNIGINEVGVLSDGSNWWLASKGKQIFPAASWSLNATITPVQDVITNLPFDTLEFNNSQGIALKTNALFAKPTQIWITNSGTYMITFSAVLKGSAGGSKISIWLRKNGSDVARTRTDQGFSGATAQQCMTVNYFVKVDTPAYYELCAASHDASPPTVEYAVANPTGYTAPAMPAIIVTINRVSDPWP